MKSERIILSSVAILVGLVVAGIAFYFYQMTKTVDESEEEKQVTTKTEPTPTPDRNLFLSVTSPRDEEVVTKKTIIISGKTTADATIVITSETDDEVVKPSRNGDFSVTQTLSDGANLLQITAIFPNGEEKRITKTVSYTSENF